MFYQIAKDVYMMPPQEDPISSGNTSGMQEAPLRQETEEIAATLQDLIQRLGLRSDQAEEKRLLFRSGRRARKPKKVCVTMRIAVADWNKFQQFCEMNDYTVAEGFELLTKNLPLNHGTAEEQERKK
jgi:hypothetical protein